MVTKAEDLNDEGVIKLMKVLVESSKKKLIYAYIDLQKLKRLAPKVPSWTIRDAYERFEREKEFFHTPLFDLICPTDPEDYISSLLKDSKKLYRHYKEGVEC
jgi:hypothetical protein